MKLHAPPDRTEEIKKWQIQIRDVDEDNVSTSIISTLYDGSMGLLKALVKQVKYQELGEVNQTSLSRDLATLFSWGRDHGVFEGELDAALQSSHRLRGMLLTLLVSLANLLSRGKPLLHKESNSC